MKEGHRLSLIQHDTDLWSSEHEFGWQAGLITIPVRMTVLRLDDKRLVLHSPVPISPQLRAELDALGPVGFIVIPRAHGRFAAQASRLFPTAELLAAPSAPSRRTSSLLPASLADHAPAAWAGQLESLLVRGFRLDEVVLFHPSSRTLVLTDLCFNIHRSSSQVSRLFFQSNGMWRHFGPSRLIRRLAVSDRAALRQSLEEVLEWNFERIIPGHGDVVECGGPAALRAAWLS
jgi:hypothetical protein